MVKGNKNRTSVPHSRKTNKWESFLIDNVDDDLFTLVFMTLKRKILLHKQYYHTQLIGATWSKSKYPDIWWKQLIILISHGIDLINNDNNIISTKSSSFHVAS